MRKSLLMITVFLLVLTLAACGSETGGNSASVSTDGKESTQSTETTLERAKRQGYVKVGFANERPYAYATSSGELTGLNVEIARTVFTELGIEEMDGTLAQFGSLIPGLQAGRFDVITAGMYITPERCGQVSFAEPEYSIGAGLAVAKGNPLSLKSYEDIIANSDAKVAIMTGAIEETYLKDMGIDPSQIVNVPDLAASVEALKAGRVDAITMTGPSLQEVLEVHGNDSVERVMDFTQPVINGESVRGYGSAAFRQADQDFVDAYNEVLVQLKKSGKILDIYAQFGFTEQELPGDVTTQDRCGQ